MDEQGREGDDEGGGPDRCDSTIGSGEWTLAVLIQCASMVSVQFAGEMCPTCRMTGGVFIASNSIALTREKRTRAREEEENEDKDKDKDKGKKEGTSGKGMARRQDGHDPPENKT